LEEAPFKNFSGLGLVLQSYLKDCEADLESFLTWSRGQQRILPLRLVKGAYWDQENIWARQEDRKEIPVFSEKWQTDAHFEQLSQRILEELALAQQAGRKPSIAPAFGTHNARSIAKIIALAETLSLPKTQIEFQTLYGMGKPIWQTLVAMGFPVRVYTPYGPLIPGMAYLVRRVLENTANESFLRQSEGLSLDVACLLQNPALNRKSVRSPEIKTSSFSPSPLSRFVNEPLTEWFRPDGQREMNQSLQKIKNQLGQFVPIVLGEKKIDSGKFFPSVNPSNPKEIVGNIALAEIAIGNQAVFVAEKAFPVWNKTPLTERVLLLQKTAALMRARRFELAAWIVYEVGKTWVEADADVAEAIDFLEYYGKLMLEWEGMDFEPLGVGVVIAPWNFPLAILTGMTAAALVTGNTVLMKPAEQSSVTGFKLMEILTEAGFPPGVVNFVPGRGEVIGKYLVQNDRVRFIAFTGSTETGQFIRNLSAKADAPKNLILETGGKNAVYVDRTADMDQAVLGVLDSFTSYNGQKCSACSRLVIHENVYEPFLAKLIDKTDSLVAGPSMDPSTQIGSVIDQEAFLKINRFIQMGQQDGKLVYGGKILDPQKRMIQPAIFTDLRPSSKLLQEEIFGPVLAVMPAGNLDEAIQLINQTRFGLTAGLFSRNDDNKKRFKSQVKAGVIYINRKITGAQVGLVGFGGIRASGTGIQAGAPDYLFQFLKPKAQKTPLSSRSGSSPAGDFWAGKQRLPDPRPIARVHTAFHGWAAAGIDKRLAILARIKQPVLPDLLASIKNIYPGPNLRTLIGIKNEFRYEPLGAGFMAPCSDRDANGRAILSTVFLGNTLLVPATEEMQRWTEVLQDAGLPKNVFTVWHNPGLPLVEDPRIRYIIYVEENQPQSKKTSMNLRMTAARAVMPKRFIIETVPPGQAFRNFHRSGLYRFLQSKSILEKCLSHEACEELQRERENR